MIEFARFLLPFVTPLSIGVFSVLLAFFCVLLRLQKSAVFFLFIGLAVFLVFGYGLFTRDQLYKLEREYQPLDLSSIDENKQKQIKFVLVSGSSHVTDPKIPESGQLDTASLYRLVEGIRIQRQLPRAWLVLSGGTDQDTRANALVAARVAESLGFESSKLLIEDRPRDIFEEVEHLQPILGDKPFVLVTSAADMGRSMSLFQGAGMHPLAAPTDFIIKDSKHSSSSDLMPSCSNMMISQRIISAWAGELWAFIRSTAGA